MKAFLGAAALIAVFASSAMGALAQEKVATKKGSEGPYSIRGKIKLVDCAASITEVRIKAAGKTAQAEANPAKEFEYSYTLVDAGFRPGQRVVITPELPATRCVGGTWRPSSRTVSLGANLGLNAQDFTYVGSPRTASVAWDKLVVPFQVAMAAIQIRLNNYASGGSFVRLDLGDQGSFDKTFNIPTIPIPSPVPIPFAADTLGTIYINDINLSRAQITTDMARSPFTMTLTMFFETRGGKEITITGPLPGIDITKMELAVVFTLERYNHSLTYKRLSTAFTLRTKTIAGWDNPLSIEQKLKPVVEAKISEYLDDPALRGAVAKILKDVLKTNGIDGYVTSMTFRPASKAREPFLQVRYVPVEPMPIPMGPAASTKSPIQK